MELLTRDFTYNLPDHRIALFPTAERHQSKLLFYNRGDINHHLFANIVALITENTLLVFNNSKVIPARLRFTTETGAGIEVFLLHPASKEVSAHDLMLRTSPVQWACTIGNRKRWKEGTTLTQSLQGISLSARIIDDNHSLVEFTFTGCSTWAEVVQNLGDTPLPPYIKRKSQLSDNERYQTVYSSVDGAVAAPTAGLHFTPEIMDQLIQRKVLTEFLTLHVSAGTFMPIKAAIATSHTMHEESVYFTEANLTSLIAHHQTIFAVGTTSCRSLESLYWFGVKLMEEGDDALFEIDQHFAYRQRNALPSRTESLLNVQSVMKAKNLNECHGQTSIFIYPGYTFRMVDGLITNFHQPNSTLLLLIAAFVGDEWKTIYNTALQHDYRFLSYGDSSLLIPRKQP